MYHSCTAEDNDGICYLCLLYDIEVDGNLKTIAVSVSKERLDDFIKGRVDLLTMFTEKEGSIFQIYMLKGGHFAEPYDGTLTDEMLPDAGFFYDEEENHYHRTKIDINCLFEGKTVYLQHDDNRLHRKGK